MALPVSFVLAASSAFATTLGRVLTVRFATFPAAFAAGAFVSSGATVAGEVASSFTEVADEVSRKLSDAKFAKSIL